MVEISDLPVKLIPTRSCRSDHSVCNYFMRREVLEVMALYLEGSLQFDCIPWGREIRGWRREEEDVVQLQEGDVGAACELKGAKSPGRFILISLFIMSLGSELNKLKQLEISKSSIMCEDQSDKRLLKMLQDKDRTIRKLCKRIDKLEETVKRSAVERAKGALAQGATNDQSMPFVLLKQEMEKGKRLQDVVNEITARIALILEDISQDRSLTDNSEEIRQILSNLDSASSQSFSQDFFENQFHKTINISQEWSKKIDVLEGAIRTFRNKFVACRQENKNLVEDFDNCRLKIEQLNKKVAIGLELQNVAAELKEERKQREKLRGLLEKSEIEKNELMNRINAIGQKDPEVKSKSMEELMQYSKELNYRIQDLEKQKEDILKLAHKEKNVELKNYNHFLKWFKTFQAKCTCGRSFT